MSQALALFPPVIECPAAESSIGVSSESLVVQQMLNQARVHFHQPVSRRTIAWQVAELAATWREETKFESSFTNLVLNSSYQRIIGLGEPAVSAILQQLEEQPDHWFWALTSITGVNPIPPEAEGSLRKMAHAWLHWGREQGYIE